MLARPIGPDRGDSSSPHPSVRASALVSSLALHTVAPSVVAAATATLRGLRRAAPPAGAVLAPAASTPSAPVTPFSASESDAIRVALVKPRRYLWELAAFRAGDIAASADSAVFLVALDLTAHAMLWRSLQRTSTLADDQLRQPFTSRDAAERFFVAAGLVTSTLGSLRPTAALVAAMSTLSYRGDEQQLSLGLFVGPSVPWAWLQDPALGKEPVPDSLLPGSAFVASQVPVWTASRPPDLGSGVANFPRMTNEVRPAPQQLFGATGPDVWPHVSLALSAPISSDPACFRLQRLLVLPSPSAGSAAERARDVNGVLKTWCAQSAAIAAVHDAKVRAASHSQLTTQQRDVRGTLASFAAVAAVQRLSRRGPRESLRMFCFSLCIAADSIATPANLARWAAAVADASPVASSAPSAAIAAASPVAQTVPSAACPRCGAPTCDLLHVLGLSATSLSSSNPATIHARLGSLPVAVQSPCVAHLQAHGDPSRVAIVRRHTAVISAHAHALFSSAHNAIQQLTSAGCLMQAQVQMLESRVALFLCDSIAIAWSESDIQALVRAVPLLFEQVNDLPCMAGIPQPAFPSGFVMPLRDRRKAKAVIRDAFADIVVAKRRFVFLAWMAHKRHS